MAGPMGPGPRPMLSGNDKKIDVKQIKKIFLYCKPYLPAIVISVLFAVISAVTTIVGPDRIADLMNIITDGIVSGIDMDRFGRECIVLVCIYAGGSVFSYAQQLIMAQVTQKTSKNLRTELDKKINRLPLSFFDKTTRGDILSRITNDVDVISQTLGSSLANLLSAVTLFFGVTIMMFVSNWILAIVTILSSTIGFAAMTVILSKSQKYFNSKQEYVGELNGQIEETYTAYKVVRSYGAADAEIKSFGEKNERICRADKKSQFLSGLMMPVMSFVGNLSYALVFIVGVALIIDGGTSVNVGTLVSFVIYAKLFSQPLTTLAQSMTSMQQASAASKRVFEVLESQEMEDENEKNTQLQNVAGRVEFRHVRFGYDKKTPVIHDFSAVAEPGQKVAIVGPTGAGKTTMVNLLMRFYETDDGDILIDGVSVRDMKRDKVRDLFDMILQDTWLFGGTIRENLVYNRNSVSDEELDAACKAVGLTHFIETLPQRYDTVIGEDTALSEGQKQQLTIARAMIKNSPLLILDEATSNVDTRTEMTIQKAMDELTVGRTSFVIAHRLSTIKNADLILVMKDGDVIERGKHKELLEQNGFYAELYNSQFMEVS